MNIWKIASLVATIVVTIFVAGAVISVHLSGNRSSSALEEVIIAPGDNLSQIANSLKEQGSISSRSLFMFYTILTGNESRLQAGTYVISPAESISGIVKLLTNGAALTDEEVTLPEGLNIWEYDERLADAGLTISADFAQQFYLEEGKLFPDTYRFRKGASQDEIHDKIVATFQEKVSGVTASQLIVASLLEKEAKTEQDMKLVAGIIAKRLELGMALQIDASVAYGACLRKFLQSNKTKLCDVTQIPVGTEIKVDSEFNTYTRPGLPPRPISNPGLKALEATRNPTPSNYLYYLSTRDGSQLIYSKTFEEHQRNRAKYLGI